MSPANRRLIGVTCAMALGLAAPFAAQAQDDVTDAAICSEVTTLLLVTAVQPGSETANRLDEVASFWRERHAALEPVESVRNDQTLAAAHAVVARVEAAPEDALDVAILEILQECQEKRTQLTSGEGE